MDSQTEDVIIMAHVETLGILLSVVHHPNGSYMVDYLTSLGVEQVAPAIITPVAAKQPKNTPCNCFAQKDKNKVLVLKCFSVNVPMNEVQLHPTSWCSLSLFHGRCSMLLFTLLFKLR